MKGNLIQILKKIFSNNAKLMKLPVHKLEFRKTFLKDNFDLLDQFIKNLIFSYIYLFILS